MERSATIEVMCLLRSRFEQSFHPLIAIKSLSGAPYGVFENVLWSLSLKLTTYSVSANRKRLK